MAVSQSWLARAIEQFRKPSKPAEIVKASNEIDVVSAFVANRPTPVETFDLRKMIDEGYRKNVIVYCCINEIAQSAAAPQMILRDRRTQEKVDEHELLDLISRPAPGLSWYELIEALLIHQQTTGIGYLHKGRSGASQIVQLKTVRPDRMVPVPDAQGNIVYWEYKIEGNAAQRIEPTDIAPFRLPDPLNDFHGLAPLAVSSIFGDIDTAAAIYLRDFFANGAMPMGLLKFKTPAVRREDRLRVQREWEETYGGGMNTTIDPNRPGRWHNVGVIGGDVEYQAMGAEPAQLRLESVWGMSESRLCATFGVPPAIIQARIGLQFSTYSNQREARRSFWTETLVPIYRRLSDGLTRNLVAEYDEDLELVFDLESIPELQEDLNARADRAVKLFAGGVASLNEARKLSDLEELTEGKDAKDYFFVPSGGTIKPKEDFISGKAGEAPEPPPAGEAPPFGGKPGEAPPKKGEAPPFGKKPPAKEPPPPAKEGQALAEDEHGLPFEVLGLGTMPAESEMEILRATETLERGFSEAVREAVDASSIDKLADALARGDWRSAEKAVACDRYIRRYGEELQRHLVREAQTALEMHAKHHAIVPRETHGWVTIKGHPVFIHDGKGDSGGAAGALTPGFGGAHGGDPLANPTAGGAHMESDQPLVQEPVDLRPYSKSPLPIVNFSKYDPKLSTPEQAAQLEATRKHVESVYSDPQVLIPRAAWDGLKGVQLRPAAAYPKKGITGLYAPDTQKVTVIVQEKHLSRNTPIHELGHHVHMAKITDAAANEWAGISKKGTTCKISNYGRTNNGEHFAEAFRNYADTRSPSKPGFLAPREWLKQKEPAAHDFMARLWKTPTMWHRDGQRAPLADHDLRYKGKKVGK